MVGVFVFGQLLIEMMYNKIMQKKISSIITVLTLCIIVFVISLNFVENYRLIGIILVGLSILCLLPLRFFKIKISSVKPDIMFGIIDNGVLAVFAIFGGEIAGVTGAIIGGAVGNALTDGIAGIFEGYSAESIKNDKRTILGSAIGKMAGCLLAAGIVLFVANIFGF